MEASFSLSAVEDFLQTTSVDEHEANMATAALPNIKIEEHVAPSTITPDLLSLASPEPTSSSSRPKKRKSWGQVLPEPKTALPPRKRAKTADEKEQRRIERVKRNRLAAHNSRERKREEMEQLQVVNDGLVAQMEAMREQMKAMAAEINALRGGSSSAAVPSSVSSFDFTTITKHESYSQQNASSVLSPPMTATTSALQTPELGNLDSPDMEIGDEFPTTPMEDGFGGENLSDPTQQSAALLCDLQCRSQRFLSCHNSSSQRTQSPSLSNSYYQQLSLMALITFQLNLQIFLSSVSTLSSTSTVMRLARKLLLPATAAPMMTSSSTSQLPSLLSMIYWTTALARQATSSTSSQPTKAHLQKVATGLAAKLRMELTHSSSPRRSSCEEKRAAGVGDGRRRKGPKRSRARRRIVMTWDVKSAISGVTSVRGSRDLRLQQALQKLAERSTRR